MTTDDQSVLATVRELEKSVRELQDENNALRQAACEFGALADRLNARLRAAQVYARALRKVRQQSLLPDRERGRTRQLPRDIRDVEAEPSNR